MTFTAEIAADATATPAVVGVDPYFCAAVTDAPNIQCTVKNAAAVATILTAAQAEVDAASAGCVAAIAASKTTTSTDTTSTDTTSTDTTSTDTTSTDSTTTTEKKKCECADDESDLSVGHSVSVLSGVLALASALF